MEIVRKVILKDNEVFIVSNLEAGRHGTLLVMQDVVGGHDLLLPNDNIYDGFIQLDKSANAITIIEWLVHDNGVFVWTVGSGFNIIPGNPGESGNTLYTWIAYADTPTTGFSLSPSGKKYLGFAYNKTSPVPSNDYNEYAWSLIKGSDGQNGNDGSPGQDGSNGQNGRNGIDGLNGNDGSPGRDGTNGRTTYFHVAYADSLDGSQNFNQSGGAFIGTYVDYTEADSTNYLDYNWARFKGLDGIAGQNGSNGETSYLHIKYSNDAGINFTGNNGEIAGDYIGQYVDFVAADSNNPALYKWSKIKGDKGDIGNEGVQGRQGAYITFDGDYNSAKTYTMYQDRIVAVKYGDYYFSTKIGTGNIPVGTLPTDGNYWNPLNSYANIATDILLAQDAYLAKVESKNIYIGDGTSGWVITQAGIKSIQTNSNGTAKTALTSDGRIFANDVDITGNVNATSGNIGGISITNNGISAPNFSIDSNGIASFTNATISGAINATSGSIGGFTFNNSQTGLNGEKIVVDGSIGAIWKNNGIADVRGGQLYIPLYQPAVIENGSVWLGGSAGTGTPNPGSGGGATLLSQLLDVMLSSPASGQSLVWNGTRWTNQTIVTSVDLSNYYTKGIANDTFLQVAANASTPQNYNFAIGYDGTSNFIQSHAGKNLDINPLGNTVLINGQAIGSYAYKNTATGNEILTDIGTTIWDIGVAGLLRWKNYGNNHVIFDASQGTAPNGTAINRDNSANNWSTSYPTLMGWNGNQTYGVRVDSARRSDDSGGWFGQTYNTSDGAVNSYLMAYGNDGQYHPASVTPVRQWLGLGSAAYNDKTRLWAEDYPDNYYITNTYLNGYWQLRSTHGAAVSVGHADDSALFQGNSIDRFQRYHSFGVDANTIADNTNSFTYAVNAPFTGTLMHFGANGYGTQINTAYGAGGSLAFRTRNGDNGTWNGWSTVWHNGTLNPQINSVPNSVVQRDVNGYINATYINSSRTNENISAASYLYDSGDGYIRKKSVYDAVSDFTSVNRHYALRFDSDGTGYNNGTLELANGTTRPSLGFHWQNVVASTISIEASGRIAIMNNPGNSYENFIANNVTGANDVSGNYVYGNNFVTGGRIWSGYDAGLVGSISCNNWFRAAGQSGLFFADYGGGLYMYDSTWIRTYNNKSFVCEAEIQATDIRANRNLIIPTSQPANLQNGSIWIS